MQQFARPCAILYLAASGMLFTGLSQAAAVYKWVDADGVTWFSETPPASELASIEVTRVAIDDYAPEQASDLQSVIDVADSIEASRLERERARREKERLMLERRQLQQQSGYDQRPYDNSYSVWYAPPYYHRPGKPYPPHGRPPEPAPYPPHNSSPPGRVTLGRGAR